MEQKIRETLRCTVSEGIAWQWRRLAQW